MQHPLFDFAIGGIAALAFALGWMLAFLVLAVRSSNMRDFTIFAAGGFIAMLIATTTLWWLYPL